jgi:nitrate/nitrite transport system substrate-binding protein
MSSPLTTDKGELTNAMTPSIPAVYAGGSDKPEKPTVKIGFLPLTDCASVVMASALGLDKKHGVEIIPSREASWASVRDKLVSGELDFAQVLYGLVYGVQLGVGSPQKDMAVLMTLNQNGQAITFSKYLAEQGAVDGESLAALMAQAPRALTFAQTFPTGTHAMWLYYWLASAGIHPFQDAKVITVPPSQMVHNLRAGNMDGYCAGEPWGQRAIMDKMGITAATSQDIWRDHPEKVLGSTADFVDRHPNTSRAVVMALLEASRWIDASESHQLEMASVIAGRAFVNTDVNAISQRIQGHYENGLGRSWHDPNHLKFFDDGQVNFPYLSDAMWFMTQHKRWGLIKEHPNYLGVASQVNRVAIYSQAAAALGIALPSSSMRSSTLIDGVLWDGANPAAYADSFRLHA